MASWGGGGGARGSTPPPPPFVVFFFFFFLQIKMSAQTILYMYNMFYVQENTPTPWMFKEKLGPGLSF